MVNFEIYCLPHLSRDQHFWRVSGQAQQFQPVALPVIKRQFIQQFSLKEWPGFLELMKQENYLPPAFIPPFRLPHDPPFDENDRPLPPPLAIRCRSGDIDMINRKLGPHDPNYFTSAVVDLDYDPRAKAPLFTKFISELVPDPDQRETLLRYLGNCLISERNRFKKFVCLQGQKDCGKSVLIETLEHILGLDNCSHLTIEELGNRYPGIIETVGKLANIANETKWPSRGEEAKIKAVTGGDVINAEVKGGSSFSLIPTIRLIYISNDPVHFNDPYIWGRVIIIVCCESIPVEKQDRNLRQKLLAELPGIFTMLVHAAMRLYRRHEYGLGGYVITPAMQALIDDACDRSDFLRQFCRDTFVVDYDQRVVEADITDAYRLFCSEGNHQPRHTMQHIKDELHRQYRSEGVDVWRKPAYRVLVKKGSLDKGKKKPAIKGLYMPDFEGFYARKIIDHICDQNIAAAAEESRKKSEAAAKEANEAAARVRRDEAARKKAQSADVDKAIELAEAVRREKKARKVANFATKQAAAEAQAVVDKQKAAVARLIEANKQLDKAVAKVPERKVSREEKAEIDTLLKYFEGDDD
jgi:P4 family phage/plasmid primase-like protien